MVKFMDRFGKMYGTNKKLGQDFITSVVDVHFGDLDPCVYLRVACILSNLASDKQSDGVAKLLTCSDVEKLKSKANKAAAIALDKDLAKSYRLAGVLRTAGHIDLEQSDELIGKFFTRSLLRLAGKGKQGPEGVTYESQAPIIADFVSEACRMAGDPTVEVDPLGEWTSQQGPTSDDVPPSAGRPSMMTEADLRDPERILSSKGFNKGAVVFERAVGIQAGLYKISSVDSAEVTMGQITAFSEPTFDVKVALADFIKEWASYKGSVPFAVPIAAGTCASAHFLMKSDEARCSVFKALKDFEANAQGRSLQYGLSPNIVVAAERIEKGKLLLAPFSELNKIKPEPSQGAAKVKCGTRTMYVSPPTRATDTEKAEKDDVFYVPYWWVRETDVEDQANVVLVQHNTVHISFKAYKNTKVLQQFDKLLVYKGPKEQHEPLKSAKRVKLSEDTAGKPKAKANAKGKAS